MADNGKFYVGVNNVAQTASKIYLGVNGVAKCVYDSAGGGGGDFTEYIALWVLARSVWKYHDTSKEGNVSGGYGNYDTANFSTPVRSTGGSDGNNMMIQYKFNVLTAGTYLVLHRGAISIAGVTHNNASVNGQNNATNFTGKEILTISANTTVILKVSTDAETNGAGSIFGYLYMMKI